MLWTLHPNMQFVPCLPGHTAGPRWIRLSQSMFSSIIRSIHIAKKLCVHTIMFLNNITEKQNTPKQAQTKLSLELKFSFPFYLALFCAPFPNKK